nr:MAG TPA_asm: hypothetical protein [Caudoviricetes sp.]
MHTLLSKRKYLPTYLGCLLFLHIHFLCHTHQRRKFLFLHFRLLFFY